MEPPPTLEEVVKEVGISLALLDKRCSNEDLKNISLFLDWHIAPHLGLNDRDIKDIKSKKTESEKSLKVLQKWKKKYSFKATFKSLVEVLQKVENSEDAEKVCRLLQSCADTGAVEMSKSQVQTLECGIDKEIEELEDQFLDIVNKAAKSMENTELSEFKRCVTQLRVSVKYQHIKFLEQKLSAINNAQSIDAIFAILGLYWDFLNCGLLYEVVRKLGNDQIKQLMERYIEKLRQFRMKTKLGDFIGKWTGSKPLPHFTRFVTEMRGDWRDRTLEDLEEFRKELARSLHMEEYAMQFTKAEIGSIAVTWALQSSLPAITDGLQSAFRLLEKTFGVLRVLYMGKCFPDLESPPTVTPTTSLALPPPPKRSRLETKQGFDIITALLDAGIPHITQQALSYLDPRSLTRLEAVSTLWKDVIGGLLMWKHLVVHNIKSDVLWKELFIRRGWYKNLPVSLSQKMPSDFYHNLYQSASRDIHTLETNWRRGHYTLTKIKTGSAVICLHYDGNKIVTGHEKPDCTIKIWDKSTLQILMELKGHKDRVWCLQFNKKVIISGSADHTVMIWDIQTGQVVNTLLHHKRAVYSLKFTDKTLVTGSVDSTVAVWDIVSPTTITLRSDLKTVLKSNVGIVCAVDLSETIIIAGCADSTIKVWDNFTGELVWTLRGHTDWVRCLQLQGNHLISGSDDKTIRIWNIDTGECVRVLHGHDNLVRCVAVDNKRILSGSEDMTVKVWDLPAALDSGSSSDTLCIVTLKEHARKVRAVPFDAFQLITCSDDESVLIHDFLDPITPSQELFCN